MEYSGARGKLIHQKNQKQKSRDTVPLKALILQAIFSTVGEGTMKPKVVISGKYSLLLLCRGIKVHIFKDLKIRLNYGLRRFFKI
jgi:hypothetical protein